MRFDKETRELERIIKDHQEKMVGMGDDDPNSTIGAGRARIELVNFLWDNKKGILNKLQMAEQMRTAIAELTGQNTISWPNHNNPELAICACVALLVGREKKMREALVAAQGLITQGLGDGTFKNGLGHQRERQASEVLELVVRGLT